MKAWPLAVALMLIVCIVPFIADDASADSNTATVDGYIKIDNVLQRNTDITVTVYYPTNTSGTAYDSISVKGLDSNGYFKIENVPYVQITRCYMSFVMNAYSIGNLSEYINSEPNLYINPGTPCYAFTNHFSDSYFINGKTYTVSSSDLHSISMIRSYGNISGRVMTNYDYPVGLNGANVYISEDMEGDNVIKTTSTSSGGYFSMTDCPTGTYYVHVRMNGYESQVQSVMISKGTTTEIPDIHLVQTEAWFGTDLPHALLIIGGVIAALILLFALHQIWVIRKGNDRMTITRHK